MCVCVCVCLCPCFSLDKIKVLFSTLTLIVRSLVVPLLMTLIDPHNRVEDCNNASLHPMMYRPTHNKRGFCLLLTMKQEN